MRINLSAALVAALLCGGSLAWGQAPQPDYGNYFRPVSLGVIEAGAQVPCETSGVPGPGCAAPAEPCCAGPMGPGYAVPMAPGGAMPVEPGCAAPESPACGCDLDNGGDCGDDCCRLGGWYANVESVFLIADRRGQNAYVILADVVNNTANQYDTNKGSLEDTLMATPRTAVGYQGECWGVLARYWSLNDTATSFDPFTSIAFNDPSGSSTVDRLTMYTFDVELTRKICWNDWNLLGTVGARYGDWESDFRVTAIENIDIVNLTTASSLAGTQFHGTGITGALGGSRQVSCCTGLGWFWNARGSYLWGQHSSIAEVTGASVDLTGSVLTDNVAFTAFDGNTFIGELQLGAQWEHELKCINARAFIRVAGEYQYWAGEDVAQSTATGTGITNVGAYLGTAEAGDPNMNLFGFSIGAGLNY